jgi:hypothetical protein
MRQGAGVGMAYKRPINEVMREFTAEHPGEVDKLTPEQLAERIGYSLGAVREYFRAQEDARRYQKTQEEEERIRALETGAVTFVTSSGSARVIYYPLLGEAKIISSHIRRRQYPLRYPQEDRGGLLLSSQDTIEIGIYLLGLQPHIRDVLAKKEESRPSIAEEEASLSDDDL